jgi:predicted TIM-barrel fold metal-dependent hydrolase
MQRFKCLALLVAFDLGVMSAGCAAQAATPGLRPRPATVVFNDPELRQFAALEPVDTHNHIYKKDLDFFAMLQRLHLHILDIVDVSDNTNPERKYFQKENQDVFGVAQASDGHAAVCTSFDPYRIRQPDFESVALRQINTSFDEGAVAVKVWKNVGMEVKDAKGHYLLPDDPLLQPLYRDIAAHHKTLITHTADPATAWLPPNPGASDMKYYVNNPEWYMYQIHGSPTKEQLLRARDHVLEKNPDLRVVGAHLGSMEEDIPQLARHLDRYANFAVDLAGRMHYLVSLPREQLIAFIRKYQDRLLYGTDNSIYPETNVRTWVPEIEASYAADWRFLASTELLEYHGSTLRGLGLPDAVLRKLYHENAVHWIPGIIQ